MGSGFRIARLFGIDIRVSPSWLLIFVFMTWSVSNVYRNEPWSTGTLWAVAIVASLLLFVSVLAHELAHSFVARAQGIEVHGITLWMLGGVSTIGAEPTSPGREALLAGAGPLTSLAIGLACFFGGQIAPASSVIEAVLVYLGAINVILAVFNMLPGYPLDGSKVLHAVLWALTRNGLTASRWATRTGVVIGGGLIAWGVLPLLGVRIGFGASYGNLWFAFIGLFVLQSSQAALRQSRAEGTLAGVSVGRVMTVPSTGIPDDITLRQAVEGYFGPLRARCLPALDETGVLSGMIGLSDLQRTDETAWGVEQVRAAMTPYDRLSTIGPEEPASAAFHRFTTSDDEYLAVVHEDRLIGFVDRPGIVSYVQTRGQAGRPATDAVRP
jgi:Zn-dependent protease